MLGLLLPFALGHGCSGSTWKLCNGVKEQELRLPETVSTYHWLQWFGGGKIHLCVEFIADMKGPRYPKYIKIHQNTVMQRCLKLLIFRYFNFQPLNVWSEPLHHSPTFCFAELLPLPFFASHLADLLVCLDQYFFLFNPSKLGGKLMRNRENSGAATALAESTTQVKGWVSRMASAALVLHTAVFIPSCIRWSKERQLKAFKALGLKHPEAQHAVTRSAVTRAQSMLQDVARCSFACKRSHVCKVHKNLQENHCQNAINWQLSARISSPARVSTPPKSNSDQNVLSVRWKFPSTFVTKFSPWPLDVAKPCDQDTPNLSKTFLALSLSHGVRQEIWLQSFWKSFGSMADWVCACLNWSTDKPIYLSMSANYRLGRYMSLHSSKHDEATDQPTSRFL